MKKYFLLILIVSILVSCNKQPVVSFTTDKSSYYAGEVIKLSNTSKHAKSYLWTMPDGRIAVTKDAEYVVPADLYYHDLIKFRLTGYSKNGKKVHYTDQYINIAPIRGDIMFWKSTSCGCGDITVTVDGFNFVADLDFPSAPPYCNIPGAASFSHLLEGNYTYSATDGVKTWNGNFTITRGCCLNIQLN